MSEAVILSIPQKGNEEDYVYEVVYTNKDDFESLKFKKDIVSARFLVNRRTLKNENRFLVGQFDFAVLPGCCGVVVSHHSYKDPAAVAKVLSDHFRQCKTDLAKKLGFSMMLCTVDMKNIPAVKSMFKSEYRVAKTFKNSETGNLISLGYKEI